MVPKESLVGQRRSLLLNQALKEPWAVKVCLHLHSSFSLQMAGSAEAKEPFNQTHMVGTSLSVEVRV